MKATTPQQVFLTNVLSSLLTIEGIEALQETTVYKREIKQYGNLFLKSLLKYSEEPTSLIWGKDDKALYNLIDYQKGLFGKLAKLRPEDIGVISEIVDKYMEHPAKTLKRMEIKIVDSENAPDHA
jgi:hypothetical protein